LTIIGFVRHGVTDWNKEGRAQGQNDVPLNAEGLLQAERLARRLAIEEWQHIFSSDLQRAATTADTIAKAMGRSVDRLDSRIREKSHGRLDGTTEADRIERWGSNWRDLDHQEETTEQVVARSLSFIEEATTEFADKRLLVVSHGAWIRTILGVLLPDLDIKPLLNTSLTVVRRKQNGWVCERFNCVEHLNL
jgi:probable phosphoglycerate mutase